VTPPPGRPRLVDLPEAASLLRLSEDGVEALVGAGYLRPSTEESGVAQFAVGDLKAFVARNADEGAGALFGADGDALDPNTLLAALDGRSEEMARRAFDVFVAAFPEAGSWSLAEQFRFIEQARKRFEAILAVTASGEVVDEALTGDLQEVGASAAWAGSSLPQLLVVLRISRDLVVQTSVEVAEERGRHWGLALSLLLTRVLPAVDRLTDAVALGYWNAVVGREQESLDRYENVVESSSDGIFEVDLDGRVQYANPSLAVILGRALATMTGSALADVLVSLESPSLVDRLLSEPADGVVRVEAAVRRTDGVQRILEISTIRRRHEGAVVGFQGVVRDVTTLREVESAKNEFLALITSDLRNPLTTILGLGATLEAYASDIPVDRIQRIGMSIRGYTERIARLADDLYDISRLEARGLILHVRPAEVASVVQLALASVPESDEVELRIPDGLIAMADARRLEQVLANLVENALTHGAAPVVVEGRLADGYVEISVSDSGNGVPPALVPTLFSRLRTFSRPDRDRSRGTGLGLALAKGLIEAMGGRVAYEAAATEGACFRVVLASP
jgi:two-component system phosphate regulon sensor histidine kinase PhoR